MTTPRTIAMAEGHVWLEEGDPLIYVFHTIRWDDNEEGDGFAPAALGGRNGEDLGVAGRLLHGGCGCLHSLLWLHRLLIRRPLVRSTLPLR